MAELCHSGAPIAPLSRIATSAERYVHPAVELRRERMQHDGQHEHKLEFEQFEASRHQHPDQASPHAEHQRRRIRRDQLVGLDEAGDHRGAGRVQHPRCQQKHHERGVSDDGKLEHRGEDGARGQQGAKSLSRNEQRSTRTPVRQESSEWSDEQQRKCGECQTPQKRLARVPRIEVEQQHLGETERRHRVGDLGRRLGSHRRAETSSTQQITPADVPHRVVAQQAETQPIRGHD